MLDLAPELEISAPFRRTWLWIRLVLGLAFFALLAYCAMRTIFPIRQFSLDVNDKSPGNSGIASSSEGRNFLVEVFSHKSILSSVNLQLRLAKGQALPSQNIKLHKTYKAFAYPLDPRPATFPDGQLVRRGNDLYLAFSGQLQPFISEATAKSMGYPLEAFVQAEPDEIDRHELGNMIDGGDYPDGTFFLISGRYYWLNERQLFPFVSPKTYQAYARNNQHITGDTELFNRYPLASESISFPEGTLLGYAGGVFLVDSGKVYSFPDELAFEAMGYSWDDVVPKVTTDEFAAFERGSALPATSPHPNNSIFFDEDGQEYFLIRDGKKKLVSGKNILSAWLRQAPITAQRSALEQEVSCHPEKSLIFPSRYNCRFDVTDLDRFDGNDYRLSFEAPENSINLIQATLRRQLNRSSFNLFISEIRYKLKFRYEFLFQ